MKRWFKKKKKPVTQEEKQPKHLVDFEETMKRLKGAHTKKHLVVDDISSNRDTLRYYLEHKDVEVSEATNGADAVSVVTNMGMDYFDVIWMDIKMPFMDGIGATSILRDRGYKNIIVMITGHIDKNTLFKCKLEGADKILAKPVIRDDLYRMKIFSIY